MFRISIANFTLLSIFVVFVVCSFSFRPTDAYGNGDPNGNITINWDNVNWTLDGYVAVVTIYNFQKQRRVQAPGWRLGWTWARKEIIWAVVGGRATQRGDCSRYKGNIPKSCKKSPTIVDLKPDTPYNQMIANCCRGGVLSSWFHDRKHSISSFQIAVGRAGTTNRTVKLPQKFNFIAPDAVYTCGPAKIVKPTIFISADRRRVIQALMTWKLACWYSGMKKPAFSEQSTQFNPTHERDTPSSQTLS